MSAMRKNGPGALVAILYLLVSLVYNVTVPLWETPDEVGHFGYIVHILQHRSLPRMAVGHLGEAHQPPLYYLLGALVAVPVDLTDPTGMWQPNPRFIWRGGGTEPNIGLHNEEEYRWPYRGWALALRLVRLFSSLLGAGIVLLVYQIARRIFPEQPALPVMAAAATAFNPQFLFITASANNDNLLTFAATGLLWHTLALQEHLAQGKPITLIRWLALGGWVWAIFLTKLTGLAIVAVALLSLLLIGWRQRRLSEAIKGLTIAFLVIMIGTSWWWIRNWYLYGDPLGWTMYRQVFAVNLRSTPLTLADLQALFRMQYQSFWGVFGWMTVYAPSWFYQLTVWIGLLALMGWVIQLLSRKTHRYNQAVLLTLLAVVLAQEGFLIAIAHRANESMWQGRYMFPAIAPIAVFLASGWAGWVPSRLRWVLAGAIGLAGVGISLFLALGVIRNAYSLPLSPDQVSVPNPTTIQFGDWFLLRGYQVKQHPGRVTVILYWEALQQPNFDYSAFVHLMDGETLIGQRDHPPGSDRSRPPSTWQPGELVIDAHAVRIPLNFSGELEIRVGVYNWLTGERLPRIRDGQPTGDWVQLTKVTVQSSSWVLAGGGFLAGAIALAWWRVRAYRNRSLTQRGPM
ncbi:MAG: hypothetical protein D6793_10195 [Thermoflexia bacterium]|nr:MAG: hypothetical protein D6793_10195 [Thermoflexia bacterium]